MLKSNYLIVAAISILTLVVSLMHYSENDLFSRRIRKQFALTAIVTIITIVIDALFFVLAGESYISPYVLYIIKASEFILNPFAIYLTLSILGYSHYHHRNDELEKIKKILFLLSAFNAVIQAFSVYFHFMFTIDDNNMYQRTFFTYLYAYFLVLCVVLLVIGTVLFSHKKQNSCKLTVLGFTLMFCFGFSSRFINQNSNFDWLCMSIALLVLTIYYYNLSQRLDALTQLLNRQVYTQLIESINYTTIVIMIDANNFKKINDTYGHESGDNTLRILAKLIYKTYSSYAYCFRLGGDEFCIILKPDMFNVLVSETPNCDVYTTSENFMSRLDTAIEEAVSRGNEESMALRYGVSQGYGIYYLPSEYPEMKTHMPLDKVIRLADKRMFRNKAKFKRNFKEKNSAPAGANGRSKVSYESRDPELIEDSD